MTTHHRLALLLLLPALLLAGCEIRYSGSTSPLAAVPSLPAVPSPVPTVAGPIPSPAPAISLSVPTRPAMSEAREEQLAVGVIQRVGPAVVTVVSVLNSSGFSARQPEAFGSGVIVDQRGYIVTNNHVVESARSLSVILVDGRRTDAQLVGSDRLGDIAVLRVDAPVPAVATFGDSANLMAGETVVAIGSALGDFRNTVTRGVISGLNRTIPIEAGFNMESLIQTDAAINHGNSGGPLLNLQGEVIGINTVVVRGSRTGDTAEGLGFAIPSNQVRTIVQQLLERGTTSRPYLALSSTSVTPQIAAYYGLRDSNGQALRAGALVTEVVPGGPAARAGLRAGDVIVSLGEARIDEQHPLLNLLLAHQAGETVSLTVVRQGRSLDLSVTLAERPQE